jgi:hypothetical protein
MTSRTTTAFCPSSDRAAINRPYNELAIALYASDIPSKEPQETPWAPGQLATWVRQGVDRLGGDPGVWLVSYSSAQAVLAQNWAAYRVIWPDKRRKQLAYRLADKIMDRATGYTYKPALLWVLVAVCDVDGSQYHRQIDARDARFAAELGIVL